MASEKEFRYHGAPVFVVALQQTVEDGQVVKGPAQLDQTAGFTPVQKSSGKGGDD
jgi:hypothetical protein